MKIKQAKKSKKRMKRGLKHGSGMDAVRAAADRVVIYTDGGCWPNPGIGGWGAVLTMPDGEVLELTGGENPSSNNRMELMGLIIALEQFKAGSSVLLYSDSQYVVNGITDWIDGWKRKGWISTAKQPVKNRELWERLDQARNRHKVTFKWIRGCAGDRRQRAGGQALAEGSHRDMRSCHRLCKVSLQVTTTATAAPPPSPIISCPATQGCRGAPRTRRWLLSPAEYRPRYRGPGCEADAAAKADRPRPHPIFFTQKHKPDHHAEDAPRKPNRNTAKKDALLLWFDGIGRFFAEPAPPRRHVLGGKGFFAGAGISWVPRLAWARPLRKRTGCISLTKSVLERGLPAATYAPYGSSGQRSTVMQRCR